jgi:hypothetical protein
VSYVEEAVSVSRPFDLFEQPVFVLLVVAGQHGVALLAGADVPLLGRHDRRCVRGKTSHPVPEHARCEDVRSVDHEGKRISLRDGHAAVEGVRRRRSRVGSQVEVAELGAEAAHVLLPELLAVVGSVLEDYHLVVQIVGSKLVCA